MADDMEEIDVASLLSELSGDFVYLNPIANNGILEEIAAAALLEELSANKTYFVPLFLSSGQNEEIDAAALVKEFGILTKVQLNPAVNSGAMDQIGFTGVQGMDGDTLSLIDFVTYQQANVNRQRRIKLISVV